MTTKPEQITFDKKTVEELRRAYNTALATGEGKFKFRGNIMLTAYAGYLLEFLEAWSRKE